MTGRAASRRGGRAHALGVRAAASFAGVVLALLLSTRLAAAIAAEVVTQDPRKVQAAFVRNFARYVTWPEDAFAGPRTPWRIGVLGRDTFREVLERTLQGRTERDRPFEIRRAQTLGALEGCHIVFVGYDDAAQRRAVLAELRGKPVLTVGDADAFLEEGGMVQFRVGETVQMSVNLDQARAGTLRIQTKMLEVSRAVLENGVTRALR